MAFHHAPQVIQTHSTSTPLNRTLPHPLLHLSGFPSTSCTLHRHSWPSPYIHLSISTPSSYSIFDCYTFVYQFPSYTTSGSENFSVQCLCETCHCLLRIYPRVRNQRTECHMTRIRARHRPDKSNPKKNFSYGSLLYTTVG